MIELVTLLEIFMMGQIYLVETEELVFSQIHLTMPLIMFTIMVMEVLMTLLLIMEFLEEQVHQSSIHSREAQVVK